MNYPLAAACAVAATDAIADMQEREARLEAVRDQLEAELLRLVPEAQKTISGPRIGHTASFVLPGAMSDSMLFLLDQRGICVSAGSACQAGVLGPSHVLTAMGYSPQEASSVLRISLGHTTLQEEADQFVAAISEVYSTAVRAGLNH
jgi:cysteine desulfurase